MSQIELCGFVNMLPAPYQICHKKIKKKKKKTIQSNSTRCDELDYVGFDGSASWLHTPFTINNNSSLFTCFCALAGP